MPSYDDRNLYDEGLSRSEINQTGIVEGILFQNEGNGFTVCAIVGETDYIAAGDMPGLREGDSVRLYGLWTEHPEYGKQFKVIRYEPYIPETEQGIVDWLSSGFIRGIGLATARKLVRRYKDNTLTILLENPEEVAKLKGMSLNKARDISLQLREKKNYQDLVMLLSPAGIGADRILSIYKEFGNSAVSTILTNPYMLIDKIAGIGFVAADKIASAAGFSFSDDRRVESAIIFWLRQNLMSGNTWCYKKEIISGTFKLLRSVEITVIEKALDNLVKQQKVVLLNFMNKNENVNKDRVKTELALTQIYELENEIAQKIITLSKSEPQKFPEWQNKKNITDAINYLRSCGSGQSVFDILSEEQKDALAVCLSSQVSVLTGGPGTGKTTMIKAVCSFAENEGGRIILAAPTGRAARRLSEATGLEAKTLHKLLAMSKESVDESSKIIKEKNQVHLNADIIVIDETSMLDCFLLYNLLSAIPVGTRLILIGDSDQLPSVGPGQVLKDMINSGIFPVAKLTKLFRQAEQSLIVRNAHRIKSGIWFELDQSFESSFIWISKDSSEDMADAVVSLCKNIIPGQYGFDIKRDVQILTPIRKGSAGVKELNFRLQQIVNQNQSDYIIVEDTKFMVDDKVMQLKNQYDIPWESLLTGENGQGIMNGETGRIIEVCQKEKRIKILFEDDKITEYDEFNLRNIDLAYAATIHKSQGSEYPVVVLVMPPSAPLLQNRYLLYTAVTRAKKKIFLISSRSVLKRTMENKQTIQRKTSLENLLRLYK